MTGSDFDGLPSQDGGPPPRIWVIAGAKTGDNAQILRAADAMGLPYEVKRIALRPEFEIAKPKVSPSLHHIDRARSDTLAPPWPDLVITIGRRLSLVALWIKQQQAGGRCKIALFNAPKGDFARFDLIVAPAYYKIPDTPSVCRIGLPLIEADAAKIAASAQRFAGSIGAMKKPLNVLLLGGPTGHMRLDGAVALDILETMRRTFASVGSIFASTSRRTPLEVADAIAGRLAPGDKLHRWSANEPDNPLHALMAFGDVFTVTGDSVSMITEVARLGRSLVIADLPAKKTVVSSVLRALGRAAPIFQHWLSPGQSRDFEDLYRYLHEGGHAVKLGEMPRPPARPPDDDTMMVARRLRHLAGVSG
ncbi:hypothetical protein BH10PSE7_BH10PSE7_13870 [soil metagenome]